MENFWSTISEVINLTSFESTSILLVESQRSTAADRVNWANLLFETFRAPSICIANSASLTVFASGRTTGLAVECGAGITNTVPIFEGLALKHAAVTMDFAGQDISLSLKKLFNDRNIQIDLAAAKTVKERMAFVRGYSSPNLPHSTVDAVSFSLPDGTDVTVVTKLLSACSDLLFVNNSLSSGGLLNQVHESIVLCDDSVRRELSNNIIISGGTTMLPGAVVC